jgi:hypothetical protein
MRTLLHTSRVRVAAAAILPILVGPLGLASRAAAQCPPAWVPLYPGTSPAARLGHALAYDSRRGVVVLFGGADGISNPNLFADTWEWDGVHWTLRTPGTAPPARYWHVMAYDSTRGVSVLFGGMAAGGVMPDTWEWDGTNWTQRIPTTWPPARAASGMVFDAARGVTVFFGGMSGGGQPLNDTWEWNGANWTLRTPTTKPSARYFHAMAYDSVRHMTVLFSGMNGEADTWEWNGTNWAARNPPVAPAARYGHSMAYGTQGTTVLFGGFPFGSGDPNNVWEWNGTSWTQLALPVSATWRYLSALAYDSSRGALVMFGGAPYGSTLLDDTWELREGAAFLAQQPVSITAVTGLPAVFAVTAQGDFGYQWRKGGTPIPGATMASYVIPSVSQQDAGSYDVVVSKGSTCQIISHTATLSVRVRADLNDDGHVNCPDLELFRSAWTGPGTPPAPCAILGDLNCDGAVSFDDIGAFVRALVGQAAYEAKYPDCLWLNGDIDGNGVVDFDDINPFVGCLVAGQCP